MVNLKCNNMIKLKDLLFENETPDIFVPRRTEDRVERLIMSYIRNGSVGNLILSYFDLVELPEILKDIEIGGYFTCSFNKLISLKNSPISVGNFSTRLNGFYCSHNQLITLEGAPKHIDGNFHCFDNELTSLKGAPEYVDGDFYCHKNKLTSLEYCPEYVSGDFYCMKNAVKFTEEQVRAVCQIGGKIIV